MSGHMEPVELVDDVVPGPSPHAARRRAWPVLLAAVAVVAVLVGVLAVVGARRDAQAARAAQVPGAVPALGDHLVARWRPAVGDPVLARPVVVGSHLVGGAVSVTGVELREVDRVTGRTVWSTEVPTGGYTLGRQATVACAALADDHGRRTRAACVAGQQPSPSGDPSVPVRMVLGIVDAADGTLVSSRPVLTRAWATTGALVVLAASDSTADGIRWTLTGTRTDGSVAWRTTTARVPATPVHDAAARPVSSVTLQSAAGRLLLTDTTHAWLLDARGRVLDDLETGVRVATLGRSGVVGTVVWSGPSGFDRPDAALVLGGREVRVGETVARPQADDGSAPDVEVLQAFDGALVARSATTGLVLWRTSTQAGPTVLLRGVLYAATSDGVDARDVRTGARRWSLPADGVQLVATDGEVLVAVSRSLDVRALRPSDGHVLWEQDVARLLPGAPDDVVVAVGSGMLQVTGPLGRVTLG